MPRLLLALLVAALAFAVAPDASAQTVRPGGRRAALRVEHGQASYYAARFQGRRTASGERYNHQALTVAHRTLPFGTVLRVTNERNGRSILVRVNDRGPHVRGRIVDLSGEAARALGVIASGTAPVTIEVVDPNAETAPEATPETAAPNPDSAVTRRG